MFVLFFLSALQGFSPNHKITSFAEAKVNFLYIRFRNFIENIHATFLLQGLDLPNERMPPRKDAPATPEAPSEAADGGNDEASKANNSNG